MKVIFLHIPKTAGTTFKYDVLWKLYKNKFDLLLTEHSKYVAEFSKISKQTINKANLIQGHMPYGIHEHFEGSFKYITFLRNPVRRVISLYYYALTKTDHRWNKELSNLSLKEFVSSDFTIELNNQQVRLIAGEELPNNEVTLDTLEKAKKNIQKFFTLGITERFNESLVLFSKELAWKSIPPYVRMNVGKRDTRDKEDIKQAIPIIKERNKLDIELYEWALNEFDQKISNIEDFRGALDSYEAKNKAYARIYPLKVFAKKMLNRP